MNLRDILKGAEFDARSRRGDSVAQLGTADAGRPTWNVVAYDFWTYTCVNWVRTLPYLRAWDEQYRENGLIVVGIHTPEFVSSGSSTTFVKRSASTGSTTRWRSTATTRSGRRSTTTTGRPSISQTRPERSATTSSAKAATNRRNGYQAVAAGRRQS